MSSNENSIQVLQKLGTELEQALRAYQSRKHLKRGFKYGKAVVSMAASIVALGLVVTVVARYDGGSNSSGLETETVQRNEKLRLINAVAVKAEQSIYLPGAYWYTKQIEFTANVRVQIEKWMDSTLQQRIVVSGDPNPRYSHPAFLNFAASSITWAELMVLPKDRDELDERIRLAAAKSGESRAWTSLDGQVFETAKQLLTLPVSSETRAASYRVIANLPNVTATSDQTDDLGRVGTLITYSGQIDSQFGDGSSGGLVFKETLLADPQTGELLEAKNLDVNGKTLGSTTYEERRFVNSY